MRDPALPSSNPVSCRPFQRERRRPAMTGMNVMQNSGPGHNRSSRIAGFHRKSPRERLDLVAAFADLDDATQAHLADMGNLPVPLADKLIDG